MKDNLFGSGVIAADLKLCTKRIFDMCPYKENDNDTCKMCIKDTISFLYDKLHRIERKESNDEKTTNEKK